MPYARFIPQIA